MNGEMEKVTISEEEIKVLRELSFEDIVKMQIISCLKVANTHPEILPIAVGMLERLFRDELPQEYWEKVKEAQKIAEEIISRRDNPDYEIQKQIFIAQEKFALLVSYVKSKIPQELIASL